MSQTLERVLEKLREMPDDRQEQFAQLLLHEIEEDRRWEQSTEMHSQKLAGLITEVLDADNRGECEPLDPEKL